MSSDSQSSYECEHGEILGGPCEICCLKHDLNSARGRNLGSLATIGELEAEVIAAKGAARMEEKRAEEFAKRMVELKAVLRKFMPDIDAWDDLDARAQKSINAHLIQAERLAELDEKYRPLQDFYEEHQDDEIGAARVNALSARVADLEKFIKYRDQKVEKIVNRLGWVQVGSTDDSNKINEAIDLLWHQASRISELERQLSEVVLPGHWHTDIRGING